MQVFREVTHIDLEELIGAPHVFRAVGTSSIYMNIKEKLKLFTYIKVVGLGLWANLLLLKNSEKTHTYVFFDPE